MPAAKPPEFRRRAVELARRPGTDPGAPGVHASLVEGQVASMPGGVTEDDLELARRIEALPPG